MKDVSSVKQLSRLLELMNSRGTGITGGADLLDNETSASKIVRLFIPNGGNAGSVKKLSPEVHEIRNVLSEIVATPGSRTAWAALNRISERLKFSVRFQRGKRSGLELKQGDELLASILKDVIEVMDRGEWERLKHCARDVCSSTFFDATRSKTQRWCPYANCGNVMNVAAHRARTR